MKIKIILLMMLFLLVITFITAFQSNSSSYDMDIKLDFGVSEANADSSSFNQSITSGSQVVSEYNSSNYTGRFGLSTIEPWIKMTYPKNTTYDYGEVTTLNYTIYNNPLSCGYTLNKGTTNKTITCGDNVIGIYQEAGSLIWTVYSNDAFGGENSSSVSFFVSEPEGPTPGGGVTSSVSVAGAAPTVSPPILFSVIPNTYEQTIVLNKVSFAKLTIVNEENFERTFNINVENLGNSIFFDETNIRIPPKQSKAVEFRIHALDEVGIYPGKLIVTSGSTTKEVLVVINVKTEKSLFDIEFLIPETMRIMIPNMNLKARINLVQMGLKEKIDVTLRYVIKDFTGNVYLRESETLSVYDKKTLNKKFYTRELLPGDYVIGVELIYPEGVAVASSQFKIQEKSKIGTKETIMIFLTSIVTLVFIMMGIIIIKRYKRIIKHLYRRKI